VPSWRDSVTVVLDLTPVSEETLGPTALSNLSSVLRGPREGR